MMENTQNNINWELLAKFFSEETTEHETNEIMRWVELSEDNKQLFEKAGNDVKMIDLFRNNEGVDSELAWKKFNNRLKEDGLLIGSERRIEIRLNKLLRIAAIIILAVGLGIGTNKIRISYLNGVAVSTTKNEYNKEVILSDGSVVYLNSNTKIRYSKEFSKDARKIYLKQGEAFFRVTPNLKKPFFVITDKAEVKVLGTSFNVNLCSENKEIEVFVKTGKVQLNKKNNQDKRILIDPGYIGTLSDQNVNREVNTDSNYMAWNTRRIVFKEERLDKVINTINRVYYSNISLDGDKLVNYKFTSTFENQSLKIVLEVICTTFQLEVEENKTGITLVEKEC